MKKFWIVGLGVMLLPTAGCNRRMEWSPVDMWNRSRYKPLEPEPFFANGSSTQAPVPGTVARGDLRTDELLYQGRRRGSGTPPLTVQSDGTNLASRSSIAGGSTTGGSTAGGNNTGLPVGDNGLGTSPVLATSFPFPVTYSVLKRGEERFNTFCSPCHSRVGDGHGMVVERGFPKPPSFHIDRLRRAPVGHYFDVITNGYGAMYPYASRVETRDRWAIIAYIRLMQQRSAKYGITGKQTEGGAGVPIFRGGTADDLARNQATPRTKSSEPGNPHDMPPANTREDAHVPQSVGPAGLKGGGKPGTAVDHETSSQPHSTKGGAH